MTTLMNDRKSVAMRVILALIVCFALFEAGSAYFLESSLVTLRPIRSSEEKTRLRDEAADGIKLNINSATPEQLQTLPGIGPSLAQAIVALRETLGGFSDIEQLLTVRGIGAQVLENIRAYVKVE